MTQLEYAKKNITTGLMKEVAKKEGLPPKKILAGIKSGQIVILRNINHRVKKPCGIGKGLSTKINANIGTSTDRAIAADELKKLDAAVKFGADTIMDLSVGPNLSKMRREILRHSLIPVGTVPVYDLAVNARKENGNFLNFSPQDMLNVLETQAKEGVDFFTVHSGITKKGISILKKNRRILDIVSRGGAIIASWMKRHNKENPFYEYFDEILDISYQYDVTLSLGDGLRPGSIMDATDEAQIEELKTLGGLALRAKKRNVQIMIEGPGHVPLDQIEKNVALEKKLCHKAPFYVLGPLVTDVASGYDHISSSIGGALAASFGADFLCYVTPAEHLRHPTIEDVRDGVVASKIAAHAADIVKYPGRAMQWDRKMSLARKARDWQKQIKLSVDPEKAKKYRLSSRPHESTVCTMCGDYCSIKLMGECLRV